MYNFKEHIGSKYSYYHDFYDGLAAVEDKNHLWGFINTKGKEVIPCQYEYIKNFSEGLCAVRINYSEWGFINTKGKIVIPCKYIEVNEFNEGLAAVQNKDRLWGFIDKNGKEIIPCKYNWAHSFKEGLAAVEDKNHLWGFVDNKGKEIIPCQYAFVRDFCEGYAYVDNSTNDTTNNFIIDKNNNKYFNNYDNLGEIEFHEGMSQYWEEILKHPSLKDIKEIPDSLKYVARGGFINKQGDLIVPCIYGSIRNFSEGLAAVRNKYGQWGFIDKTGTVVIPYQYSMVKPFSEGYAAVAYEENKWVFIDKNGNKLFPLVCESVSSFHEGLAHIKYNNGDYYITPDLNIKIAFDCLYEATMQTESGEITIKANNKIDLLTKKIEVLEQQREILLEKILKEESDQDDEIKRNLKK